MAKRFITPFAEAGDRSAMPDAPVGTESNYQTGYPSQYEEDPVANPSTAKFVERDKTNQLFNDMTANIKEWQEHTFPAFITSAVNGDLPFAYKKNSIVNYLGVDYASNVDGNEDTPPSSKWDVYSSLDTFSDYLKGPRNNGLSNIIIFDLDTLFYNIDGLVINSNANSPLPPGEEGFLFVKMGDSIVDGVQTVIGNGATTQGRVYRRFINGGVWDGTWDWTNDPILPGYEKLSNVISGIGDQYIQVAINSTVVRNVVAINNMLPAGTGLPLVLVVSLNLDPLYDYRVTRTDLITGVETVSSVGTNANRIELMPNCDSSTLEPTAGEIQVYNSIGTSYTTLSGEYVGTEDGLNRARYKLFAVLKTNTPPTSLRFEYAGILFASYSRVASCAQT